MCNRFLRTKKGQVGVCTFKDAIVRRAIAPTRFLANQLTLSGPGGGQILPVIVLLAPPQIFGRCGVSDLWIFDNHEYLGVPTNLTYAWVKCRPFSETIRKLYYILKQKTIPMNKIINILNLSLVRNSVFTHTYWINNRLDICMYLICTNAIKVAESEKVFHFRL